MIHFCKLSIIILSPNPDKPEVVSYQLSVEQGAALRLYYIKQVLEKITILYRVFYLRT